MEFVNHVFICRECGATLRETDLRMARYTIDNGGYAPVCPNCYPHIQKLLDSEDEDEVFEGVRLVKKHLIEPDSRKVISVEGVDVTIDACDECPLHHDEYFDHDCCLVDRTCRHPKHTADWDQIDIREPTEDFPQFLPGCPLRAFKDDEEVQ